MANDLDFTGKTALVTGGSRGIGAEIARALAFRGAKVAINFLDDPEGRNRADADAVRAACPGSITIAADVSDAAQVQAMGQTIQKELGGLDFLVNNAGILRDRSLKKMAIEDFDALLKVNLYGAFYCIKLLSEGMRTGGRIVNMASVAGVLGFFGQANYATSKAGLIGLTKVAARELARNQITVNAIAPGFISTEMIQNMPEDVTRKFIEQIPLGRLGTVQDIAGAVVMLCSPLASYITGQVLHVNGGFHMGST
jgi:3-oxoacyl-[acyl-carrier protein] reductase